MILLIDTNIILDYLLKREPFYKNAKSIMAACSDEKIQGCIALPTVTNLWYILRKVPDASRRSALRSICELLEVVGTAHDEVISAIEMTQFKDFEDCIQTKCAKASKADYIVTRNVIDFQFSEIPVLSPEDALRIINL